MYTENVKEAFAYAFVVRLASFGPPFKTKKSEIFKLSGARRLRFGRIF